MTDPDGSDDFSLVSCILILPIDSWRKILLVVGALALAAALINLHRAYGVAAREKACSVVGPWVARRKAEWLSEGSLTLPGFPCVCTFGPNLDFTEGWMPSVPCCFVWRCGSFLDGIALFAHWSPPQTRFPHCRSASGFFSRPLMFLFFLVDFVLSFPSCLFFVFCSSHTVLIPSVSPSFFSIDWRSEGFPHHLCAYISRGPPCLFPYLAEIQQQQVPRWNTPSRCLCSF